MAENAGGRRSRRAQIIALATAIHESIGAYNRRHPTQPFAINDAVSRILANAPDYRPPRKRRATGQRPLTENPGVFTVKDLADKLETTVGELLHERGFEITTSDRRSFLWIVDFLRMRFALEGLSVVLPDEGTFVAHDFSLPRPPVTTNVPLRGELAAGVNARDSDFEITEAEVVGKIAPSCVAAIVNGRSMADRIRDGDVIVIDTSRTSPKQNEPVAVYIENEGGIIGYWQAEAGSYYLKKHNVKEFARVKLPHASEWRVIGTITAVQSRTTRQDCPT